MTFHSIPRKPNALFDLADKIVNSLAEKRAKFVAMDPSFGLELLTHLNAAMYAFGAYLAIRDGAKYSVIARAFLRQAACTWHRTKKELRQCLRALAEWLQRVWPAQ